MGIPTFGVGEKNPNFYRKLVLKAPLRCGSISIFVNCFYERAVAPSSSSSWSLASQPAPSQAAAVPDLDRNSFQLISLRYLTLAHNREIFDIFVPPSFLTLTAFKHPSLRDGWHLYKILNPENPTWDIWHLPIFRNYLTRWIQFTEKKWMIGWVDISIILTRQTRPLSIRSILIIPDQDYGFGWEIETDLNFELGLQRLYWKQLSGEYS